VTETAMVTTNHNKHFVVRDPMEVRNEIKECLVKKWKDEQEENVKFYNANNFNEDDEEGKMERECGIYDHYEGP
jgi:Tfp pilus assembly major pilin PilA